MKKVLVIVLAAFVTGCSTTECVTCKTPVNAKWELCNDGSSTGGYILTSEQWQSYIDGINSGNYGYKCY